MALKIFFFFPFIVCVLCGAQKDKWPKRAMEDFNFDDDKQGYHVEMFDVYVVENKQMHLFFENVDEVSFADTEKKANEIYHHFKDDWSQILDVVRQEQYIDVDYVGKRFVRRPNPVDKKPKERIERAIFRIDSVNNTVTKKDMALMIYSEGYRDYTCRSIMAKRSAMMGAGFCPIRPRCSHTLLSHLRGYWRCIRRGSDADRKDLYCSVGSQEVAILYQMIYMHKHGILDDLAKDIAHEDGTVKGAVLERQNAILAYLQERAGQPCNVMDITDSMQQYLLPRGVLYEIANLVFLGKADVDYSVTHKTCTLVTRGTRGLVEKDACDELVLFQNTQKYLGDGSAILKTYAQGARTYPPEKMILFKKAFELMNMGENFDWAGREALLEFLKNKPHIPPVWQWDEDMEEQGKELLAMFYPRVLDAVFDMHNRGTLSVVQDFAQSSKQKKYVQGDCRSVVKEFLCKNQQCGLGEFADFLKKSCTELHAKMGHWRVVSKIVEGFVENVYYNIEKDVFTWVDHPALLKDTTKVSAVQAACVLRKSYPAMGVDCLAFVLKNRGFDLTHEYVRILFSALDVAGYLPQKYSAKSAFMQLCREAFVFLSEGPRNAEHNAYMQEAFRKDSRIKRTAEEALQIYQNDALTALAQQTQVVQGKVRGFYQSCTPEKRGFYKSYTPAAKRKKPNPGVAASADHTDPEGSRPTPEDLDRLNTLAFVSKFISDAR